MKATFLHCAPLRIEVVPERKQRRTIRRMRAELGDALMPILDEHNRSVRSENALLFLVCAERGDEKLLLGPVVADVLASRAMIGVPEIVISAFAHLSERPAPPRVAIEVIGALVRDVRAVWPDTREAPFGYDKILESRVLGHHQSVSTKSYSPDQTGWDHIANRYHRHMQTSGHYAAEIRLLDRFVQRGFVRGNVLDVCCGAGVALGHISRSLPSPFLVGIDSSETMISLARRNLSVLNPGHVNFLCQRADGPDRLFAPSQFDSILLANALAYLDVMRTIQNLRDTLKPDGHLVVMEEDPFLPGFLETTGAIEIRQSDCSAASSRRELESRGFKLIDESRTAIDTRHELVGRVFEK